MNATISSLNSSHPLADNLSMLEMGDFLLNGYDDRSSALLCDSHLDTVFLLVDVCIGAFILAGNSFAVTVFIFGGQLYRSHMNVFLMSLAISDILLALIVIPSYAAFCTGCSGPLSDLCWFFEGGKDYTFLASVFNLLAISYDRHIAVFSPLLYNLRMTERRVIGILTLIWILPGVLAGLRNGWQHVGDPDKIKAINSYYTYFLLFVFIVIPIITVCVINIRIIHAVRLQVRRIQGRYAQNGSSDFNHACVPDREAARRKRGTISCVLVVGIFVVCWLPRASYYIFNLSNRPDLGGPLLLKLSVTFLLFQSSLNPIIYSFFRSEFRQSAKRLCLSLRKKLQNTSWIAEKNREKNKVFNQ